VDGGDGELGLEQEHGRDGRVEGTVIRERGTGIPETVYRGYDLFGADVKLGSDERDEGVGDEVGHGAFKAHLVDDLVG
jgi:hypothetical protein